MGLKLKLLAALVGLVFGWLVMRSIRRSNIRPTFAWLWLGVTFFLLSVPFLEPMYKWFSVRVLGIEDARTLIYVSLIGFLLVYVFYMTIMLSMLSDRLQELITHVAILESRLRRPVASDPEDGAR